MLHLIQLLEVFTYALDLISLDFDEISCLLLTLDLYWIVSAGRPQSIHLLSCKAVILPVPESFDKLLVF